MIAIFEDAQKVLMLVHVKHSLTITGQYYLELHCTIEEKKKLALRTLFHKEDATLS